MSDLLEQLRAQYPLLEVINPAAAIEQDFLHPGKVDPDMLPVVEEFIIRYAFITHATHKGDIGEQAAANSIEVERLRNIIVAKHPYRKFAINFHGHIVYIKTDADADTVSRKIKIKFIRLVAHPEKGGPAA
jgi:hypothetical protein